MSANHTPGPWAVSSNPADFFYGHVIDTQGVAVAKPMAQGCRDEANARLIAAAPELVDDGAFLCARLRELENDLADDEVARQFHGHIIPALARLEAAIAKALGQEGGAE